MFIFKIKAFCNLQSIFLSVQINSREPVQPEWGRAAAPPGGAAGGDQPRAAGPANQSAAAARGAPSGEKSPDWWTLKINDQNQKPFLSVLFLQEAELAREQAQQMASLAASEAQRCLALEREMEEMGDSDGPRNRNTGTDTDG